MVVGGIRPLSLFVYWSNNANLQEMGNISGDSKFRPKSHSRLAGTFSSSDNLFWNEI